MASIVPSAMAARKVIPMTAYSQGSGNGWCWAASDKMIIQELVGTSPSLQTLVDDYGETEDGGASIAVAQEALNDYGIYNSLKYDSQTYNEVQSQINLDEPIFCRLSNGGGWIYRHAVVMRGYDTSTSFVLYLDPTDGLGHGMTYSLFCDGEKWDGAYSEWDGTIYNNTDEE